MLNGWTTGPGLGVLLGVAKEVLVAVVVAEPVTSGKIPFPQPELGRSRNVNAPITKMGRRRDSLATLLRESTDDFPHDDSVGSDNFGPTICLPEPKITR